MRKRTNSSKLSFASGSSNAIVARLSCETCRDLILEEISDAVEQVQGRSLESNLNEREKARAY